MRARHGVGHGVEPNRQVQIGAVLATQYRQATDPRSSPTSALFPAAIRPGIASATESPSPLQRQAHHQIKFRRIAADSRRHRHPALLWQYYTQLVAVEEAFKNLKGDLAIRPIFHQDEHRVEAHIFIAFLAYCLQITLQRRLHALARD